MLDPKGLEAARDLPGTNHEAIIRAYLSTATPAKVGGLAGAQTGARAIALEVFHNVVDSDDGSHSMDMPVAIDIIAAALEAQAAELAGALGASERFSVAWRDAERRAERAEATLAEERKALAQIERKICAAEHGHTINDVLANYREVRRTVQGARTARHALTGGQDDG